MKKLFKLLTICSVVLISNTIYAAGNLIPPGLRNPEVTQENIHQTICVPGWSASKRPSSYKTNGLKKKLAIPGQNIKLSEGDHALAIELGGLPWNPKPEIMKQNFWLQPWGGKCGARTKDKEENIYHDLVCNGTITLEQAQARFMPWTCTE